MYNTIAEPAGLLVFSTPGTGVLESGSLFVCFFTRCEGPKRSSARAFRSAAREAASSAIASIEGVKKSLGVGTEWPTVSLKARSRRQDTKL